MKPFRCGHPREAGNVYVSPAGHSRCSLCERVRMICRSAKLAQDRINAGGYTLGERIMSGAA